VRDGVRAARDIREPTCVMGFIFCAHQTPYIYCYVPHIRYGTSLALHRFIDHLGDTNFDHFADVLAFLVIVYLVVRSNVRKVSIPSILKTIAQDATYYFLVIFTSHLLLMIFFWFASVSTSS